MPPARTGAHVYWNGTFSDSSKQACCTKTRIPSPRNARWNSRRISGASWDRLPAYLWFDQKYFLPDDILAKVDRMSMAHSIEVRPPFLDHRIVEFAASLPDELKMDGANQKVVLRELMKHKLPPSILRRKKIGFDIPAHEWLRGPLRGLLLETLASGAAIHGDFFRRSAIERAVTLHMTRRENLGYHLWGLMILFLWMRKWRIETSAATDQARVHAAAASSR